MKPASLSATQKFLLALSLPATLLFLYFLLKKDEEEEENEEGSSKKPKTLRLKVPRESVAVIIGTQGVNAKALQEKTGTQMSFIDESPTDHSRTLVITGSAAGVVQAESLVHQIINDHLPTISEVIYIPRWSVGIVRGCNRERLRNMSSVTNARITINRVEARNKDKPYVEVELRGTSLAVSSAKKMIMDLISKSEESRQEQQSYLSGKSTNVADRYSTCYVSAVVHPGHFWIQKVEVQCDLLGGLIKEMNEYYNNSSNVEESHSDYKVGDMVATKLPFDDNWYRAEVRNIVNDDLDLYFVDFGDSEITSCNSVKRLRSEFLNLPYQAMECRLAHVKPTGESWSLEEIEKFESLTHVASWRPLLYEIVGFKAGSHIPHVVLFDTNDQSDVNIGKELVASGCAVDCLLEDMDSMKGVTTDFQRTHFTHSTKPCSITEESHKLLLQQNVTDQSSFENSVNIIQESIGLYESRCDHDGCDDLLRDNCEWNSDEYTDDEDIRDIHLASKIEMVGVSIPLTCFHGSYLSHHTERRDYETFVKSTMLSSENEYANEFIRLPASAEFLINHKNELDFSDKNSLGSQYPHHKDEKFLVSSFPSIVELKNSSKLLEEFDEADKADKADKDSCAFEQFPSVCSMLKLGEHLASTSDVNMENLYRISSNGRKKEDQLIRSTSEANLIKEEIDFKTEMNRGAVNNVLKLDRSTSSLSSGYSSLQELESISKILKNIDNEQQSFQNPPTLFPSVESLLKLAEHLSTQFAKNEQNKNNKKENGLGEKSVDIYDDRKLTAKYQKNEDKSSKTVNSVKAYKKSSMESLKTLSSIENYAENDLLKKMSETADSSISKVADISVSAVNNYGKPDVFEGLPSIAFVDRIISEVAQISVPDQVEETSYNAEKIKKTNNKVMKKKIVPQRSETKIEDSKTEYFKLKTNNSLLSEVIPNVGLVQSTEQSLDGKKFEKEITDSVMLDITKKSEFENEVILAEVVETPLGKQAIVPNLKKRAEVEKRLLDFISCTTMHADGLSVLNQIESGSKGAHVDDIDALVTYVEGEKHVRHRDESSRSRSRESRKKFSQTFRPIEKEHATQMSYSISSMLMKNVALHPEYDEHEVSEEPSDAGFTVVSRRKHKISFREEDDIQHDRQLEEKKTVLLEKTNDLIEPTTTCIDVTISDSSVTSGKEEVVMDDEQFATLVDNLVSEIAPVCYSSQAKEAVSEKFKKTTVEVVKQKPLPAKHEITPKAPIQDQRLQLTFSDNGAAEFAVDNKKILQSESWVVEPENVSVLGSLPTTIDQSLTTFVDSSVSEIKSFSGLIQVEGDSFEAEKVRSTDDKIFTKKPRPVKSDVTSESFISKVEEEYLQPRCSSETNQSDENSITERSPVEPETVSDGKSLAEANLLDSVGYVTTFSDGLSVLSQVESGSKGAHVDDIDALVTYVEGETHVRHRDESSRSRSRESRKKFSQTFRPIEKEHATQMSYSISSMLMKNVALHPEYDEHEVSEDPSDAGFTLVSRRKQKISFKEGDDIQDDRQLEEKKTVLLEKTNDLTESTTTCIDVTISDLGVTSGKEEVVMDDKQFSTLVDNLVSEISPVCYSSKKEEAVSEKFKKTTIEVVKQKPLLTTTDQSLTTFVDSSVSEIKSFSGLIQVEGDSFEAEKVRSTDDKIFTQKPRQVNSDVTSEIFISKVEECLQPRCSSETHQSDKNAATERSVVPEKVPDRKSLSEANLLDSVGYVTTFADGLSVLSQVESGSKGAHVDDIDALVTYVEGEKHVRHRDGSSRSRSRESRKKFSQTFRPIEKEHTTQMSYSISSMLMKNVALHPEYEEREVSEDPSDAGFTVVSRRKHKISFKEGDDIQDDRQLEEKKAVLLEKNNDLTESTTTCIDVTISDSSVTSGKEEVVMDDKQFSTLVDNLVSEISPVCYSSKKEEAVSEKFKKTTIEVVKQKPLLTTTDQSLTTFVDSSVSEIKSFSGLIQVEGDSFEAEKVRSTDDKIFTQKPRQVNSDVTSEIFISKVEECLQPRCSSETHQSDKNAATERSVVPEKVPDRKSLSEANLLDSVGYVTTFADGLSVLSQVESGSKGAHVDDIDALVTYVEGEKHVRHRDGSSRSRSRESRKKFSQTFRPIEKEHTTQMSYSISSMLMKNVALHPEYEEREVSEDPSDAGFTVVSRRKHKISFKEGDDIQDDRQLEEKKAVLLEKNNDLTESTTTCIDVTISDSSVTSGKEEVVMDDKQFSTLVDNLVSEISPVCYSSQTEGAVSEKFEKTTVEVMKPKPLPVKHEITPKAPIQDSDQRLQLNFSDNGAAEFAVDNKKILQSESWVVEPENVSVLGSLPTTIDQSLTTFVDSSVSEIKSFSGLIQVEGDNFEAEKVRSTDDKILTQKPRPVKSDVTSKIFISKLEEECLQPRCSLETHQYDENYIRERSPVVPEMVSNEKSLAEANMLDSIGFVTTFSDGLSVLSQVESGSKGAHVDDIDALVTYVEGEKHVRHRDGSSRSKSRESRKKFSQTFQPIEKEHATQMFYSISSMLMKNVALHPEYDEDEVSEEPSDAGFTVVSRRKHNISFKEGDNIQDDKQLEEKKTVLLEKNNDLTESTTTCIDVTISDSNITRGKEEVVLEDKQFSTFVDSLVSVIEPVSHSSQAEEATFASEKFEKMTIDVMKREPLLVKPVVIPKAPIQDSDQSLRLTSSDNGAAELAVDIKKILQSESWVVEPENVSVLGSLPTTIGQSLTTFVDSSVSEIKSFSGPIQVEGDSLEAEKACSTYKIFTQKPRPVKSDKYAAREISPVESETVSDGKALAEANLLDSVGYVTTFTDGLSVLSQVESGSKGAHVDDVDALVTYVEGEKHIRHRDESSRSRSRESRKNVSHTIRPIEKEHATQMSYSISSMLMMNVALHPEYDEHEVSEEPSDVGFTVVSRRKQKISFREGDDIQDDGHLEEKKTVLLEKTNVLINPTTSCPDVKISNSIITRGKEEVVLEDKQFSTFMDSLVSEIEPVSHSSQAEDATFASENFEKMTIDVMKQKLLLVKPVVIPKAPIQDSDHKLQLSFSDNGAAEFAVDNKKILQSESRVVEPENVSVLGSLPTTIDQSLTTFVDSSVSEIKSFSGPIQVEGDSFEAEKVCSTDKIFTQKPQPVKSDKNAARDRSPAESETVSDGKALAEANLLDSVGYVTMFSDGLSVLSQVESGSKGAHVDDVDALVTYVEGETHVRHRDECSRSRSRESRKKFSQTFRPIEKERATQMSYSISSMLMKNVALHPEYDEHEVSEDPSDAGFTVVSRRKQKISFKEGDDIQDDRKLEEKKTVLLEKTNDLTESTTTCIDVTISDSGVTSGKEEVVMDDKQFSTFVDSLVSEIEPVSHSSQAEEATFASEKFEKMNIEVMKQKPLLVKPDITAKAPIQDADKRLLQTLSDNGAAELAVDNKKILQSERWVVEPENVSVLGSLPTTIDQSLTTFVDSSVSEIKSFSGPIQVEGDSFEAEQVCSTDKIFTQKPQPVKSDENAARDRSPAESETVSDGKALAEANLLDSVSYVTTFSDGLSVLSQVESGSKGAHVDDIDALVTYVEGEKHVRHRDESSRSRSRESRKNVSHTIRPIEKEHATHSSYSISSMLMKNVALHPEYDEHEVSEEPSDAGFTVVSRRKRKISFREGDDIEDDSQLEEKKTVLLEKTNDLIEHTTTCTDVKISDSNITRGKEEVVLEDKQFSTFVDSLVSEIEPVSHSSQAEEATFASVKFEKNTIEVMKQKPLLVKPDITAKAPIQDADRRLLQTLSDNGAAELAVDNKKILQSERWLVEPENVSVLGSLPTTTDQSLTTFVDSLVSEIKSFSGPIEVEGDSFEAEKVRNTDDKIFTQKPRSVKSDENAAKDRSLVVPETVSLAEANLLDSIGYMITFSDGLSVLSQVESGSKGAHVDDIDVLVTYVEGETHVRHRDESSRSRSRESRKNVSHTIRPIEKEHATHSSYSISSMLMKNVALHPEYDEHEVSEEPSDAGFTVVSRRKQKISFREGDDIQDDGHLEEKKTVLLEKTNVLINPTTSCPDVKISDSIITRGKEEVVLEDKQFSTFVDSLVSEIEPVSHSSQAEEATFASENFEKMTIDVMKQKPLLVKPVVIPKAPIQDSDHKLQLTFSDNAAAEFAVDNKKILQSESRVVEPENVSVLGSLPTTIDQSLTTFVDSSVSEIKSFSGPIQVEGDSFEAEQVCITDKIFTQKPQPVKSDENAARDRSPAESETVSDGKALAEANLLDSVGYVTTFSDGLSVLSQVESGSKGAHVDNIDALVTYVEGEKHVRHRDESSRSRSRESRKNVSHTIRPIEKEHATHSSYSISSMLMKKVALHPEYDEHEVSEEPSDAGFTVVSRKRKISFREGDDIEDDSQLEEKKTVLLEKTNDLIEHTTTCTDVKISDSNITRGKEEVVLEDKQFSTFVDSLVSEIEPVSHSSQAEKATFASEKIAKMTIDVMKQKPLLVKPVVIPKAPIQDSDQSLQLTLSDNGAAELAVDIKKILQSDRWVVEPENVSVLGSLPTTIDQSLTTFVDSSVSEIKSFSGPIQVEGDSFEAEKVCSTDKIFTQKPRSVKSDENAAKDRSLVVPETVSLAEANLLDSIGYMTTFSDGLSVLSQVESGSKGAHVDDIDVLVTYVEGETHVRHRDESSRSRSRESRKNVSHTIRPIEKEHATHSSYSISSMLMKNVALHPEYDEHEVSEEPSDAGFTVVSRRKHKISFREGDDIQDDSHLEEKTTVLLEKTNDLIEPTTTFTDFEVSDSNMTSGKEKVVLEDRQITAFVDSLVSEIATVSGSSQVEEAIFASEKFERASIETIKKEPLPVKPEITPKMPIQAVDKSLLDTSSNVGEAEFAVKNKDTLESESFIVRPECVSELGSAPVITDQSLTTLVDSSVSEIKLVSGLIEDEGFFSKAEKVCSTTNIHLPAMPDVPSEVLIEKIEDCSSTLHSYEKPGLLDEASSMLTLNVEPVESEIIDKEYVPSCDIPEKPSLGSFIDGSVPLLGSVHVVEGGQEIAFSDSFTVRSFHTEDTSCIEEVSKQRTLPVSANHVSSDGVTVPDRTETASQSSEKKERKLSSRYGHGSANSEAIILQSDQITNSGNNCSACFSEPRYTSKDGTCPLSDVGDSQFVSDLSVLLELHEAYYQQCYQHSESFDSFICFSSQNESKSEIADISLFGACPSTEQFFPSVSSKMPVSHSSLRQLEHSPPVCPHLSFTPSTDFYCPVLNVPAAAVCLSELEYARQCSNGSALVGESPLNKDFEDARSCEVLDTDAETVHVSCISTMSTSGHGVSAPPSITNKHAIGSSIEGSLAIGAIKADERPVPAEESVCAVHQYNTSSSLNFPLGDFSFDHHKVLSHGGILHPALHESKCSGHASAAESKLSQKKNKRKKTKEDKVSYFQSTTETVLESQEPIKISKGKVTEKCCEFVQCPDHRDVIKKVKGQKESQSLSEQKKPFPEKNSNLPDKRRKVEDKSETVISSQKESVVDTIRITEKVTVPVCNFPKGQFNQIEISELKRKNDRRVPFLPPRVTDATRPVNDIRTDSLNNKITSETLTHCDKTVKEKSKARKIVQSSKEEAHADVKTDIAVSVEEHKSHLTKVVPPSKVISRKRTARKEHPKNEDIDVIKEVENRDVKTDIAVAVNEHKSHLTKVVPPSKAIISKRTVKKEQPKIEDIDVIKENRDVKTDIAVSVKEHKSHLKKVVPPSKVISSKRIVRKEQLKSEDIDVVKEVENQPSLNQIPTLVSVSTTSEVLSSKSDKKIRKRNRRKKKKSVATTPPQSLGEISPSSVVLKQQPIPVVNVSSHESSKRIKENKIRKAMRKLALEDPSSKEEKLMMVADMGVMAYRQFENKFHHYKVVSHPSSGHPSSSK